MSILIVLVIIALLAVGVLGTVIPGLPGIGLVYAGILIYAFADGFTSIQSSTVLYLGILTLVASVAQYIGSAWAAKSGGGKHKAIIGTLIGGFLGLTAGPVGIFLGAFLGAFAGALLEGSTPEGAGRIALRSVIGVISGSIIQFFLSIALISAFVLAILF